MVAAFSTNTLGFLTSTLGLVFCIWLVTFLYQWAGTTTPKKLTARCASALSKTARPLLLDLAGLCIFLLIAWPTFVIRTVYFDHSGLVYANSQQKAKANESRAQVLFLQNNITTTSNVFINIRDLLTAFAVFRQERNNEPCLIEFTAPKETEQLADVFANYSNATSNCQGYGPAIGSTDPDEIAEATLGMIPDAIVFHAARDDKAANVLFDNLSNRIKLVRRYDLPKVNQSLRKPRQHTIWLQFGSAVKWNSEMSN
jgi:hypothetical protein